MDPNQQKLVEYIRQELAKGSSEEQIKDSLREVGWYQEQVDSAFAEVRSSDLDIDQQVTPSVSNTDSSLETSPMSPQNVGVSGENDQVQVQEQQNLSVPKDVATQQISEEPEKQKRRFPRFALISLILLLLIVAVAAVYGYFYYYLAPERIASESIKKMQTVKTYDYTGSVLMKLNGNLFSGADMPEEFAAFSFTGSMDAEDENNIKTNNIIGIGINSEEVGELEVVSLGNISYIKLNSFNLFPLEEYLDTWLYLNIEELSEEYDLDYEEQEFEEVTEEDQNTIYNSFINNNPVEIIEKLDDEEINGKDTFHFKYVIHKDSLKSFLQEVAPILQKYPQSADVDVSELNNIMDGLEFYEGEVWIGKEDYFIYRVIGGMTTDIPDSEARLEIALDLEMDNFNQTKNIIAPTDYKTFEELNKMLLEDMSELYPATGSGEFDSEFDFEEYNEFLRALRPDTPSVMGQEDGK